MFKKILRIGQHDVSIPTETKIKMLKKDGCIYYVETQIPNGKEDFSWELVEEFDCLEKAILCARLCGEQTKVTQFCNGAYQTIWEVSNV